MVGPLPPHPLRIASASEYIGRVNKSFRRHRGTVNLPVVNLSCRVRNILKSQGVAIGFVVIEISCHH